MNRILIVGVGALGGTIAARAMNAGIPIWLATRTNDSAKTLRASGLKLSGIGGPATVDSLQVAPLEEYRGTDKFDLIILATKAREALDLGPVLAELLAPGGTLLPIQNGSVPQMLSEQLGDSIVLGGLSNLGATMVEPGVYEQRNAGHLFIGELAGGISERATRVANSLRGGIEFRVTPNLSGTMWAKLLLNCSVTTIGAVAGQTMRQYMTTAAGPGVFRRMYEEALSVALATGTHPEKMVVEPVPPGWDGKIVPGVEYNLWLDQIIATYGDLKPSMLQDFERGRLTEIDFINGYVAQLGDKLGIPVALNAATTRLAHLIEQGKTQPSLEHLDELAVL